METQTNQDAQAELFGEALALLGRTINDDVPMDVYVMTNELVAKLIQSGIVGRVPETEKKNPLKFWKK